MTDLNGKNVAVVGMARSGIAAIELLREKGANVRAVDSRSLEELKEYGERLRELRVALLPQQPASFNGADLAVLSPGVPVDIPEITEARNAGMQVIGEVELAGYFLQGPIIGVTGSNGKTTTTSLIGHILRESGLPSQVGGNIGTPPTSMISSSRAGQWNVLELSSFQLETIVEFRAGIGLCLNITPDHLDRHYTLDRYANAKARLFETQSSGDHAVLNADDPICSQFAERTKAQVAWFSLSRPVNTGVWLDKDRLVFDGEPFLDIRDIPLPGRHNVENAAAASAASRLAGASPGQIASAVKTFPGVEHRLEFVREVEGVRYFNDSKATNVDATQKAIDAFSGGLWIILGGKDKNSDYTVLRSSLDRKAKGILLIGAAADKIAAQLGPELPLIRCGTVEAAVQEGHRLASRGETVLLAPACASFDQFENYEHRGRVFKSAVMEL